MSKWYFKKMWLGLRLAWQTTLAHPARTLLSLLGVMIGVLSVVVVMLLGEGVKGFVVSQGESFGSNTIQIEVKVPTTGKMSSENATSRAQGAQITTLTTKDRDALRDLPNVAAAYAGTIGQERAVVGSVGKRILLFGTGAEAPLVDGNIRLTEGRFFTEEEDGNLARVVVLGQDTKQTFFGNGQAVGEAITIKGEKYRVIGVLAPRGAAGFINLDTFTYVPVETLKKKILGVNYVQMIAVKMDDISRERETVADITALLRKRHDIDHPSQDDFAVTSTKEALAAIEDVLGSVTVLLLALTSISLLVGGVGIMNVMYVSVTERVSEIGLRKALGATEGNILSQFLFEALLITAFGGVAGITLGLLLSFGLSALFAFLGVGITLTLTPQALLLGATFSILTGVIFGLAPAYRAARLSPMEALRKGE